MVSTINEILWALTGLILTILATFIEVSFLNNLPWDWADSGVNLIYLGITYQIGAVLLAACVGGKTAGAMSQIAYVVIGLFWLPIFAKGGGLGYLTEPSFGYILGFIPGAWVCGWLAFRKKRTLENLAFSSICGLCVIHAVGIVYLFGLFGYYFLFSESHLSLEYVQEAISIFSLGAIFKQLILVCEAAVIGFLLRLLLFY